MAKTRFFVSSMLLLAAFVFLRSWSHGEAVPIRNDLDELPMELGPWQGREATLLSDEILRLLEPTDYLIRRYEDPRGRSLWLYVGYWETQRTGTQIHSPKHCLPGGGWEPLEARVVALPLDDSGRAIEVNRYLLQKGADQLLVTYWYQSQGQAIAGELDAKIAMVRSSILENRSDGALVRISSPVYGSVSDTWAWLVDYVHVMYPRLDDFLPN